MLQDVQTQRHHIGKSRVNDKDIFKVQILHFKITIFQKKKDITRLNSNNIFLFFGNNRVYHI